MMVVRDITALYRYGVHDSLLGNAWREGRQTIPIIPHVFLISHALGLRLTGTRMVGGAVNRVENGSG